jgi:hypothetical protein
MTKEASGESAKPDRSRLIRPHPECDSGLARIKQHSIGRGQDEKCGSCIKNKTINFQTNKGGAMTFGGSISQMALPWEQG